MESDAFANIMPPRLVVPDIDTSLSFEFSLRQRKNLFEETKRKAWDSSVEPRCDFSPCLRLTRRSSVNFISVWQKSLYGRTLSDIKSDDSMVDFFALSITPVICDTIGQHLNHGDWAIVTSPKRRHKEKNFATRVAAKIAEKLQIQFYENAASCHSRQRINAEFSLNMLPSQANIIIYDDIVTTGQTLLAMKKLLTSYGKNIVFVANINNA